jgi:hypothetical protein
MTSACGCLRWLGLAVYLLYSLQYPSTSCGESIYCLEFEESVASTQWNLNFSVRVQASYTLLPQSLSLRSILKYIFIEVVYHVNGVWKRDILDVRYCSRGHLKKNIASCQSEVMATICLSMEFIFLQTEQPDWVWLKDRAHILPEIDEDKALR